MDAAMEFYVLATLTVAAAVCAVFVRSTLVAALFHTQSLMLAGGVLVVFGRLYTGFALFALACATFVLYLLFSLILSDKPSAEKPMSALAARVAVLFVAAAASELCWLMRGVPDVLSAVRTMSATLTEGTMFVRDVPCVLVMAALFLTASVGIGVLLLREKGNDAALVPLAGKENGK